MKDIRLLPLVIVAIAALFALKGIELMFGGASLLGGDGPAMAQDAATQDAGGQPQDPAQAAPDQGGATDAAQQDAATGQPASDGQAAADGSANAPPSGDTAAAGEAAAGDGGANDAGAKDAAKQERSNKTPEQVKAEEPSLLQRVFGGESRSRDALLESLAKRREELDAREKELDLRENLLKAAEQRVEQRIAELKELESSIKAMTNQRDAEDQERMKNVVTMYENMKPKDAARIFNDLDMSVVAKVASMMSARQMSLVMAEMNSEVAQRLTLELSAEPVDPIAAVEKSGELPQIVGTRPAN